MNCVSVRTCVCVFVYVRSILISRDVRFGMYCERQTTNNSMSCYKWHFRNAILLTLFGCQVVLLIGWSLENAQYYTIYWYVNNFHMRSQKVLSVIRSLSKMLIEYHPSQSVHYVGTTRLCIHQPHHINLCI